MMQSHASIDKTGKQKKLRLAIFSPFFTPEMISTGKVNTLLAAELVRQGWEVDVVCSHPLYPGWKPQRSDTALPGTTLHRGGAWVRYSANPLLRRFTLELWFALHTAVSVLRLPRDVDVALMVYPPSLFGPVAQWLLPKRVRRVAMVHDLQSEYSQRGFHSSFSLLTWLIQKVERRCLRGSDLCIFSSHDIARIAQETFTLEPEQMVVQYPFVTIGMPESEVPTSEAQEDTLESLLPKGVQHVVYSGALGEKQNPRLLAALMDRAALAHPEARFHIFSGGPLFESLRMEYAVTGAVEFHDLVAEEQLEELYARSAVQLIPQAPGTESCSLPSKLPNLLAAGTQVLAMCSAASEVATLLHDARTGTLVPEWTEAAFLEGVGAALASAAAVTPATRREQAAAVLALCRVSSLAQLVVG